MPQATDARTQMPQAIEARTQMPQAIEARTQMPQAIEARLEAVRASAGSGKTYSLTTSYLRWLIRGASPESILATTFTRKAAGEIFGRVLLRLAQAACDAGKEAELAAALGNPQLSMADFADHLTTLVRSLHRVSVSTIDSYFNKVAQSFRHELGLPPRLELVDPNGPQAIQLRLEAIRQLLQSAERATLLTLLERIFLGAARRSVTATLDQLVQSLYETYRHAPVAAWKKLEAPQGLEGGELEDALARFQSLLERVQDKRLKKAMLRSFETCQAEQWEAFIGGLAGKINAGETTYYRKEIPSEILDAYAPLIRQARSSVIGALLAQTTATFELLEQFDREYSALRRREQVVLFSDLPLLLARELPLHEVDALHHRLDFSPAHLLLDEFQDTSPEQWRVLQPLAQHISSLTSHESSFYCVGDTKQAIYAWRGGVAEIFERLEQDIPGLVWDTQSTSYRSSQQVLDAVNLVFGELESNIALTDAGPVVEKWQKGYAPHVAAKTELPGFVELLSGPADSEPESASGDDLEGETPGNISPVEAFAAEEIRQTATRSPNASIGVLVRTNDAVRRLLFLLQRQGLLASGEGGNPVADDPAVETVLAAMVLADHPGDSIAEYQLRHSPLGAIIGLETRAPSDGSRSDVFRVTRAIRKALASDGYARVVSAWARALAPFCTQRSATRLTQLVQLADDFGKAPTLRPEDFVRFVRTTTVEEPHPARVRVMTVHKAKGLEFDVVFLLELHKRLVPMSPTLLIDRPDPTGPIQGVFRNANATVRGLDPMLSAAHTQFVHKEINEGLSELYVAMTRARQILRMIVSPPVPTSKGLPRKEALSHSSILRAALSTEPDADAFEGRCVLFQSGDPRCLDTIPLNAPGVAEAQMDGRAGNGSEQQSIKKAESQTCDRHESAGPAEATEQIRPPRAIEWNEPLTITLKPSSGLRRGFRRRSPSALEGGGILSIDELLRSSSTEARAGGTLIHRWFEEITWLDSSLPSDESLLRLARTTLSDRSDGWYKEKLAEFKEMVTAPRVVDLLSRQRIDDGQEIELWRERNFVVRIEGELLRGSFDRVHLRRENGIACSATIIDYKTDHVSENEMDSRAETYKPQLEAYRSALANLETLARAKIRCILLFVSLGEVREV